MTFSVSLVAPASHTEPKLIDDAIAALATLGIDARVPASLQAPRRYLAGSVAHRLDGLYEAYADPDTQAVWAVRGGYGCAQLVEHIDWSRLSPKPLIGYSDITVMLDQCYRQGLPAIHGPVIKEATRLALPSQEQRTIARRQFEETLALAQGRLPAPLPLVRYADSPDTTRPCPIEGPLVGGNLTTLASVAGTPAGFVAPPGALVILEDVGEPYYRLERALWQLVHAGGLDRAGALCLGTFEGCTPQGDTPLAAIFAEVVQSRGIPLFTGLPIGHGLHNRPWRYGARGRITQDRIDVVD